MEILILPTPADFCDLNVKCLAQFLLHIKWERAPYDNGAMTVIITMLYLEVSQSDDLHRVVWTLPPWSE